MARCERISSTETETETETLSQRLDALDADNRMTSSDGNRGYGSCETPPPAGPTRSVPQLEPSQDHTRPLIDKMASFARQRLGQVMIMLLLWGTLWGTLGAEALPPNGKIWSLFLLFVGSSIGGELSSLISLPPLLGMLSVGFLISNTTSMNFDRKMSSILRSFALTVILLRAGLGLDPKVLKKLSGVCLRLAFAPCLTETIVIGVVGHYLLSFPFEWSFLLGFIMSAVSSAVVIPDMISFQERKLGTNKGIPTLLMAALSVDNVLAVTGFGVLLGLCFASQGSSLVWQLFKGPVEAIVGLLFGSLLGIILWFLPPVAPESQDCVQNSIIQRFPLLLLGGTVAVFASNKLSFSGSGPLGTLSLAFVAALRWRFRGDCIVEDMESKLKLVWDLSQPFLFGLIGAEAKISTLKGDFMWPLILTLSIGLLARCASTFVAVHGIGLSLKEKLFVVLAWISKATVQAALGPVALDMARLRADPEAVALATTVLTAAVIAIVLTAPLGAVLIAVTSRWLKSEKDEAILNGDNNTLNEITVASEQDRDNAGFDHSSMELSNK